MSKITFLSFEKSIADLEEKLEKLRLIQEELAVDVSGEIDRLSKKSQELTKTIRPLTTTPTPPENGESINHHPSLTLKKGYLVLQLRNMVFSQKSLILSVFFLCGGQTHTGIS